jgi:AraC-like DNA-binding protein
MTDLIGFSTDPVEIIYQETYNAFEIGMHFHNSYEIIYVTEGKIRYKTNDKVYIVEKNSAIFISNLEVHEIKILEYPYKRYFTLFKPDYFQSVVNDPILISIFKHRPSQFKHVVHFNEAEYPFFEGIIKSMYMEVRDKKEQWQLAIGSYIHLFIIALYRSHKESFPLTVLNKTMYTVLEIQRYIEEHYMEDVNLKILSSLYFIDMYYLSHLFKKVTGFTFKEYLILYRISKAKELLFNTDSDITQVGLDTGFPNVNHFIRIFKKYEAITPYQYKKKLRN